MKTYKLSIPIEKRNLFLHLYFVIPLVISAFVIFERADTDGEKWGVLVMSFLIYLAMKSDLQKFPTQKKEDGPSFKELELWRRISISIFFVLGASLPLIFMFWIIFGN
jgi:hypothetical protein